MGDKSLAEILMDDDELEVVEELKHEDRVEKMSREPRRIYSTVLFEVGPDIRVRVIDVAIVIVTLLLAYMVFKNI